MLDTYVNIFLLLQKAINSMLTPIKPRKVQVSSALKKFKSIGSHWERVEQKSITTHVYWCS